MKSFRYLIFPFTMVFISACATHKPIANYRLPRGSQAKAWVSVDLKTPGLFASAALYFIPQNGCIDGKQVPAEQMLITAVERKKNLKKLVTLPADQPIGLLLEMRPTINSVCVVSAATSLVPNKKYRIGGDLQSGGFLSFGNCVFSIVDESTGMPMPLFRLKNGVLPNLACSHAGESQ